MADAATYQRMYEELADRYDRQKDPRLRDVFLILAADIASATGRPIDAERLRQRLLQRNPYHMLRPYPSFADALKSRDIQDYVTGLRQQYPPEAAETLWKPKSSPAFSTDATEEPRRPTAPASAPIFEPPPDEPEEPETRPAPSNPRMVRPTSPYEPNVAVPLPVQPTPIWNRLSVLLLFVLLLLFTFGLVGYLLVRPYLNW